MARGFRKQSLFLFVLRLLFHLKISPSGSCALLGSLEVESLIPDYDALGVGKPTPVPLNPGPIVWYPKCQNLSFLGEQRREQDTENPGGGSTEWGKEEGTLALALAELTGGAAFLPFVQHHVLGLFCRYSLFQTAS